ncbi:MAG: response regulator transcription factor [Actinomycetia bacterium]|nr:response regulator transcription factor [Actinomycetes bacterium]MCP4223321.1 response regulator transcription factor [Actinomycetes bacterium]MCP5030322.1 response regulator transcription factor [Actinomycetes bacterium]
MIKILLADDHSLLREGLKKSFESAGDHVVGEASNGEEAVALARALQPQVVLMDLSMPVMDGIEATRRIRQEVPGTRVAVLTMHDDIDKTRDAIAAGASAYLSKGTSFAEVRETVLRVAEGDTVLSPAVAGAMLTTAQEAPDHQDLLSDRQVEILQSIADGMSTKQAGRYLGITTKTVHNHLNAIYRKLDAQSLTHAVLSAVRMGIINLDSAESEPV